MTENVVAPTPLKMGNRNVPVKEAAGDEVKVAKKPLADPDRFLRLAKALVVQNHNETRQNGQAELSMDTVFISSFAKVLSNWKAIIESPAFPGSLWVVTFNRNKDEAYINRYRMSCNVIVPLGEKNT